MLILKQEVRKKYAFSLTTEGYICISPIFDANSSYLKEIARETDYFFTVKL